MSCTKKHDIVPDLFAISQYTDIGYFPISGRLHDVRDDMSPAASAPPPPAARTGQALRLVQPPSLPRRSNLNRHAAL